VLFQVQVKSKPPSRSVSERSAVAMPGSTEWNSSEYEWGPQYVDSVRYSWRDVEKGDIAIY
jgi:hypothetical protein